MKILGASLGELLRHGSQFGLGVQAAGRQNVMNQQAADKARREELQQALIDQANIEQSKASVERDRAYAKNLAIPEPPKMFNPQETAGRIRKWMSEHPGSTYQDAIGALQTENPGRIDTGTAYDTWSDIDRESKADKRAADAAARSAARGRSSVGDRNANARGYAEELAVDLTSPTGAPGPQLPRRDLERQAIDRLIAKYPEIGRDAAGSIVRREFASILDKNTLDLNNPFVQRIISGLGGTPTDTIP